MTIVSETQAYTMGWIYKNKLNESHELGFLNENLNKDVGLVTDSIIKLYSYTLPSILTSDRKRDFFRGLYDRRGKIVYQSHIEIPKDYIPCSFMDVIEFPYIIRNDLYVWEGVNALEFLAYMYKPSSFYSKIKYNLFLKWCNPTTHLLNRPITFKWSKSEPTVHPPLKNRFSDSGYDLHLEKKLKVVNGVHYYDTGISVEPENGYYFELVGRSSIAKTGWMLANNVGIIDASYRGNIIVPLVKINNNVDELTLPIRLVQIIPKPLVLLDGIELDKLSGTKRGENGFGSSV